MLFTLSLESKDIELGKHPELILAIKTGKIYIYGKINFLYEDDGLTAISYSEERLLKIVENHGVKSSLFIEGNFFIACNFEDSFYFFSDFFGQYRTYYTFIDNLLLVSESPEKLIEINSELNDFEQQIFNRKGYTGRHFTTYKNLYRAIGGQYYYVTLRGVDVHLLFEPGRVGLGLGTYQEFENIIDSTFPYFFSKDKKNVLQFSGGIDSTFLALYAKNNGYDIELVTGRIRNPSLDQNKYDVTRSLRKSFELNVPFSCIDVNLLNLDAIVEKRHSQVKSMMPFEKHFGKLHVTLATSLENRKHEIVVINGQNADSIACLGPSEKINLSLSMRGILSGGKGLLTRFLLSKYYCAIVTRKSDKPDVSIRRFLNKKGVRIPVDRENYLLVNMFYSKGYLPIVTEKISVQSDLVEYLYKNYCKPYENFSIGEALYISKLQNFMHGGDHRIVLCSHAASDIEVSLPFTSIALFRFFANYDRSFDYILRGKGYLEDFLYKHMRNFEDTVTPTTLDT